MKQVKQPSIDDLLFMDDDPPGLLPVGQGHKIDQGHVTFPGQGQQIQPGPVPLSEEMMTDCFVDLKAMRNSGTESSAKRQDVNLTETKAKTKLSAPVSLHTRSRSIPVENVTDSSQSSVNHNRSRSKDFENEPVSKMKTDPFDFVDKAMKSSKRVASPVGGSKVAMETESYSCNKSSANGRAKGTENAAVSVAKKFTTKSHTESVKVQSALKDSESVQDTKGAYNPLYEHNRLKGKEISSKNCSQEAGKQGDVRSEDENTSSQDTYEMDISSSPVY